MVRIIRPSLYPGMFIIPDYFNLLLEKSEFLTIKNKESNMTTTVPSKGFIYRCPLDCPFRKHCFVLKVPEELKYPLTILHKCRVTKADISITIGGSGLD